MTEAQKKAISDKNAEIEQLKAKLAELEGESVTEAPTTFAEEEKPIRQDEYISVMSLLPYTLNLSTEELGGGKIKKFVRYGEIKKIIYKDLLDIVESHPSFMESGYFYIMDRRFIREQGLDEIYSKILTKEKIDEILTNTDIEKSVALYRSANSEQQRIIIQLFVDKMVQNPGSIDMNVVKRLSDESGINIMEKVELSKAPELQPLDEPEK